MFIIIIINAILSEGEKHFLVGLSHTQKIARKKYRILCDVLNTMKNESVTKWSSLLTAIPLRLILSL